MKLIMSIIDFSNQILVLRNVMRYKWNKNNDDNVFAYFWDMDYKEFFYYSLYKMLNV